MIVQIKEVCNTCSRSVSIGQAVIECSICNCIIHHRCYKSTNSNDSGNFFCDNCSSKKEERYNPFKFDIHDDEADPDDSVTKLTSILENCTQLNTAMINKTMKDLSNSKGKISLLFQNIDGNKSNFDMMCIDLCRYNQKFSVIALAETNVGPDMSSLYQLSEYNSFYQLTSENKRKGTGVAMYVHNSLLSLIHI